MKRGTIAAMKEFSSIRSMMQGMREVTKGGPPQTVDLVLLELLDMKRAAVAKELDTAIAQGDTPHTKTMRRYLNGEQLTASEIKSLEAQTDPRGGFLLGQQLLEEFIDAQAQASAMRRLARQFILEPGADSAAAPNQDLRLTDAEWTSELFIGAEDAIEPFGARAFYPRPLAKFLKASKTMLRKGRSFAENIITDLLAEAVALPAEEAMINGDGAVGALGLLQTSGIGATTTAAAGQLAIADVKKWIGGLGARYHGNATALMHVDTYSCLLQLDTAGALIQGGRLLGKYPIEFSDRFPTAGDNPASLTSGTKIAAIGDFRYYWIVDSLETSIQVLRERWAETNQDGYLVRAELDAQCVNTAAFNLLAVQ